MRSEIVAGTLDDHIRGETGPGDTFELGHSRDRGAGRETDDGPQRYGRYSSSENKCTRSGRERSPRDFHGQRRARMSIYGVPARRRASDSPGPALRTRTFQLSLEARLCARGPLIGRLARNSALCRPARASSRRAGVSRVRV